MSAKSWSAADILSESGSLFHPAQVDKASAPDGRAWTVGDILNDNFSVAAAYGVESGAARDSERKRGQRDAEGDLPATGHRGGMPGSAAKSPPARQWTVQSILSEGALPLPALSGGAGPGSKVGWRDPLWDDAERVASQRTGVPVEVIRAIRTKGERSNANQVSPAGARGVYQFIPKTRSAFLKKYGVDAYSQDPVEQATAAAYHLRESYRRTGDWLRAAAGYNGGISAERGTNKTAENRGYVQRIGADPGVQRILRNTKV